MPPPNLQSQNSAPAKDKSDSASGSIIGSFRNLLGQKKSQNGSSTTSTPSAETPKSSDHLSLHRAGADTKPPVKNFSTDPSNVSLAGRHVGTKITTAALRAGPAELEALITKLGHDYGMKERCKAANSLISVISGYTLDGIGSIWQRAADLLDQPGDSTAFETGLQLLQASLKSPELSASDRRVFFDTITKQLTGHPDACIDCLGLLTSHGRDFHGLDLSRVVAMLVKLMKYSHDAVINARKQIKNQKAGSYAAEYERLTVVFQYMSDSIKFSASMFSDSQLANLLEQVLLISLQTSQEAILEQAVEFVGVIVTYATLPLSCFQQLMDVLCTIYGSVSSLRSSAEAVIWKMLGSHLGSRTVQQMLTIIIDSRKDSFRTRGAIQLFQSMLAADEEAAIAKPETIALLSALAKAFSSDSISPGAEYDILLLLRDMLLKKETLDLLFDERTWVVFTEVLESCAYGAAAASFVKPRASDPSSPNRPFESECSSAMTEVRDALLEHTTALDMENTTVSGDSSKFDTDRNKSVMIVLLRLARFLDEDTLESVTNYHTDERLHLGPQMTWFETCRHLRKGVFEDERRPLEVRLTALSLLHEAYSTAIAFGLRESELMLKSLMKNVRYTTDPAVMQSLAEMVVDVSTWTDNADLFDALVETLRKVLFESTADVAGPQDTSMTWSASANAVSTRISMPPEDTSSSIIAKSLVRIFLRTLNKSFTKANKIYSILLDLVQSNEPPAEARVTALKVLVRLRSDINNAIFVVPKTESQSLAAALCRTADSAILEHIHSDSSASRPVRIEENSSRRRNQGTASNSSSLSRANSSAGRPSTNASRISKPKPPLWMYPGPKGLPEDPSPLSSHLIFSHFDSDGAQSPGIAIKGALNIGKWLDVVLDLLNSSTVDWEIFSYIIVHLGAQLSNHSLFVDAIPQIKVLRRVICEKIASRNYIEPPSFSNLKKSDAAVCFYQILTMLIAYGDHFNKDDEQDPIVKSLVLGIGSFERTSEICIHGLSICCHEMPSLLVRYLESMLQRMSQIITQSNVAAPALEFLATLARLPELFRNFRNEDFRTVFGMCFRFLQYVRDKGSRTTAPSATRIGRPTTSSNRASRDISGPVDNAPYGVSLGESLPQYVHALAYHVMTFWFMALKLQDRPGQINWIIRNLSYTDDQGNQVMEEQGQVTIDMMYRVAFCDRDETLPDSDFAQPADGHVSSRSYMLGTSILTVETAGRTGVSQLTTRRPSGTIYFTFRPQIVPTPRHQAPVTIGLAADEYYSDDYVGIMPEHVMQMMYSPYTVLRYGSSAAAPIALPDDEATKRAISTFDRTPALDGHKVGIIYVGEGQTSEASILANVMGSADYMDFLNGIGTLTELKGATFNTQGLDREFDSDGKFTYCWRDRVTELVFHVTTMMPTNLEVYPRCDNKKRHTGNDFVNIIFNNSGLPFEFDTFPSDFNFVNIVVTPEARASFVETRIYAKDAAEREKYYKVTVMTKQGLPNISPAAETKIISGTSLPAFVRLLALNASVFSQVWANREGSEYISSWLSRLRAIEKLRVKHAPTSPSAEGSKAAAVPEVAANNPPPAPAPATDSQRGSTLFRRMSVATLFSDNSSTNNNRNSGLSFAGDVERSSSSGSQDR